MPYQFALARDDYSAFASGQVLHSLPGRTAFPVRLASEVFGRAAALLGPAANRPLTLYDPCCGGAQLLTTLGFLHGDRLARAIGSDVDPAAVELAARNLALLTPVGLDARIAALAGLHAQYGKDSHRAALDHARALRARLPAALATDCFVADATAAPALLAHLAPGSVDLAIADIPHGQHTTWRTAGDTDEPPATRLLAALLPLLARPAIVAVAADRRQRIGHPDYRRAAQFELGKRRVTFLAPGV